MGLKVVNLGLPKSGTTTLAKALAHAGYSVADHRLRDREENKPGRRRVFVSDVLYRGLYDYGDPMAMMQEYDALSEISKLHGRHSVWPQFDFGLLLTIRRLHPGVKFIATRRDAVAHSRSIMNWTNLGKTRLPQSHIPGLPPGFGASELEQRRWITNHHLALNQFFRGDDDFLEIDVSAPNSRRRLARFLGHNLPWWGKANVNIRQRAADRAAQETTETPAKPTEAIAPPASTVVNAPLDAAPEKVEIEVVTQPVETPTRADKAPTEAKPADVAPTSETAPDTPKAAAKAAPRRRVSRAKAPVSNETTPETKTPTTRSSARAKPAGAAKETAEPNAPAAAAKPAAKAAPRKRVTRAKAPVSAKATSAGEASETKTKTAARTKPAANVSETAETTATPPAPKTAAKAAPRKRTSRAKATVSAKDTGSVSSPKQDETAQLQGTEEK